MGKKKIIFGSIFVLALMLMMPCIPAIQHSIVEDKYGQRLEEKLESINLNDLEDIEKLDGIKHPILFLIVSLIYYFREFRGFLIYDFSFYYYDDGGWGIPEQVIEYSILYMRGLWLMATAIVGYLFFRGLSDSLGWNWSYL